MLTVPLAPGITCSLLGCACHSAYGTTLSPKRDQIYAWSETKFTPEASQNLRPKRTPARIQSGAQISKLSEPQNSKFTMVYDKQFLAMAL